ncbi:hypothetical protein J4E89_002238 [Alternaria sp. Ai002NY15]|nr:hypothetical protein J4E89_002238 [Alternaria sp. Ai002NY15]
MKLFLLYCLLSPYLAQAASQVYTGFNYGAFWGAEENAKQKADFLDGFNLARNLTTDIPFDSARLFTCRAAKTLDEPTEAFDAAVASKTNLLLGFWITPAQKGGSPDENVKNEMAALEKGFKKHGQALSDLIIGLSVGNEDVYRAEATQEVGVTATVVGQTIAKVKESIASSSFAQYMKDKPIGHVDTAQYAVVDNADFIGMTAYPYWNKDSIGTASTSFQGSLEGVKQRAGNRPVWIAEMGWPFTDSEQHGAAVAGIDELQKFWSEVGCAVFGKYTTFWFELLKDTTSDQKADWSVIDPSSRQSRIKNMSCGNPQPKPPAAAPASSQASSTSIATSPSETLSSGSPIIPSAVPTSSPPVSSTIESNTVHVTVTGTTSVTPQPITPSVVAPGGPSLVTVIVTLTSITTVTAQPSMTTIASASRSIAQDDAVSFLAQGQPATGRSTVTVKTTATTVVFAKTTAIAALNSIPVDVNWCVTVADINQDGSPIPVAGGPAASGGECVSPPTFQGYPYAAAGEEASPSAISSGTSWCVIMADIDNNGRPVPVDAGPAGADGECAVPPMYSGLSATATLIGNSKTPEPAQVSLKPTSLTVEFSLLSSINVPAASGFPSPTSAIKINIASTEFYLFHHFSQPTLRPIRRNSLRV